MAGIAFLFSGQGGQYPGMGKHLYENFPAAKSFLNSLEDFQPGLLDLCFQGTPEQLKLTINTQPAVYAVDMAAAMAITQIGIIPKAVAGFSLGELAALAFAGVDSPLEMFKLVQKRAALMSAAADKNPGAMLAVLRMENSKIEELCQGKELYPVNYNCPGQLVVAGKEELIEYLQEKIKEAGGRSIKLAVGGGFHSPLMDEASQGFLQVLKGVDLKAPNVDVYANLTGRIYSQDVADFLVKQINHPVLWEETIREMTRSGIDCFIELGPGKVLCGFVEKIAPGAAVYSVDSMKDLEAIREELINVKE